MKVIRKRWRLLPLLLFLFLASGCVTKKLWTGTALDCWNEPADGTHLRLFQTSDERNFLVVYDEYSERGDSIRTRAYLLNENEQRIKDRHAPYFTDANRVHGLTPVPLFPAPFSGAKRPSLFAVEGHECFTVYQGVNTSTHDLPVYNDGRGVVDRVVLTPLTVTADATVIGGLLWLESGCAGLPGAQ